jgi:acylphosphatase
MLAHRYSLKGRVQGVGFRYFTLLTANELGIKGWVRNLSNGDLEVHAEGPEGEMRQFLLQIESGPSFAIVEHVDVQKVKPVKCQGFSICK